MKLNKQTNRPGLLPGWIIKSLSKRDNLHQFYKGRVITK